jgi:hypothetical protein
LKRRELIALLGGTTLVWPLVASCSAVAAEPGRWRIGYLSSMDGPTELAKSFVRGLRELGYTGSRRAKTSDWPSLRWTWFVTEWT